MFVTPAYAQAASGSSSGAFGSFIPLILVVLVIWLAIRAIRGLRGRKLSEVLLEMQPPQLLKVGAVLLVLAIIFAVSSERLAFTGAKVAVVRDAAFGSGLITISRIMYFASYALGALGIVAIAAGFFRKRSM